MRFSSTTQHSPKASVASCGGLTPLDGQEAKSSCAGHQSSVRPPWASGPLDFPDVASARERVSQPHRPGRGEWSPRCSEAPPPRLRRGIDQFNRREFFEQHETLEEEWIAERDPVRYLFQGILQIGVGFEHLRRGNPFGARPLWRRGISYLEPFRCGCMNVDVDRLVCATERCLEELERVGEPERFDDALIPRVGWLS